MLGLLLFDVCFQKARNKSKIFVRVCDCKEWGKKKLSNNSKKYLKLETYVCLELSYT